jgi:hypothetical protein
MRCPHCHQNAPIVYRGVFAFCSACDKPRAPFSGKALHFAGQPAKVGGNVSRVVGYVVLAFGLLAAAALMLFFQLLVPERNIGYAVGLPIALISTVLSLALLFASSKLRRAGTETEFQTRLEALYALAVNRGGTLTAEDASHALHLPAVEVDGVLDQLAKTQAEFVQLEIDEEGKPFYLFSNPGTRVHPFGAKYRVEPDGKVRVADVLGVNGPREDLNDAVAGKRAR